MGLAYVQVLGIGTLSSPPVLVFTENARYLFNVGDGAQRFFLEHKVRMTKFQRLFFTRMSAETFGGFPGVYMSLADMGVSDLSIVGPQGLGEAIGGMFNFAARANMGLSVHHAAQFCSYNDAQLSVECYPTGRSLRMTINSLSPPQKKLRLDDECSGGSIERNLLNAPHSLAVSYICSTPEEPGKFDAKRADDLGVPRSKLRANLVLGETIVLEDGRMISPDAVLGPPRPGVKFAVVDCPTEDNFKELLRNPKFSKQVDLSCIIHLSPLELVSSLAYSNWILSLNNTEHVIASTGLHSNWSTSPSCNLNLARLGAVAPELVSRPVIPAASIARLTPALQNATNVRVGDPLLKYDLKSRKFDKSAVLSYTEIDVYSDLRKNIDFQRINAEVQQKVMTLTPCTDSTMYPLVSFLGTGSAMPSKYRNSSCICLSLAETNRIIFDMGEGSLEQLHRMASSAGLEWDRLLASIRCVWISHKHADHHVGLSNFISERLAALKRLCLTEPSSSTDEMRLRIIAPRRVIKWLFAWSKITSDAFDAIVIDCSELVERKNAMNDWFRHVFDVDAFHNVHVSHCAQSYGAILRHNSGWSIAYSGDTRPCDALVEAGKDVTLLIHEATFDDDMADEAAAKKHSTVSEAISVGARMNAQNIVLTHFSQRYPKCAPGAKNDAQSIDTRQAAYAFDFLNLPLSAVPQLTVMRPAFDALFPHETTSSSLSVVYPTLDAS